MRRLLLLSSDERVTAWNFHTGVALFMFTPSRLEESSNDLRVSWTSASTSAGRQDKTIPIDLDIDVVTTPHNDNSPFDKPVIIHQQGSLMDRIDMAAKYSLGSDLSTTALSSTSKMVLSRYVLVGYTSGVVRCYEERNNGVGSSVSIRFGKLKRSKRLVMPELAHNAINHNNTATSFATDIPNATSQAFNYSASQSKSQTDSGSPIKVATSREVCCIASIGEHGIAYATKDGHITIRSLQDRNFGLMFSVQTASLKEHDNNNVMPQDVSDSTKAFVDSVINEGLNKVYVSLCGTLVSITKLSALNWDPR